MPETPYSPGALRAWANYMSRLGWHEVAAQLNAQADAAEQMQTVGSTWLSGYAGRLGWPQSTAQTGWRPQATAAISRPGASTTTPYGGVNPYLSEQATPANAWQPVSRNYIGGPGAPGVPYGGVNPYLSGQAALPVAPAPYAGWMGATPLGETPMLQTLLAQRAARAGGGGELGEGWGTPKWNPWSTFGTGKQAGWYAANPATGYVNFAGKTLAGAQADIAGNFPKGSRLFYGSPTYGNSPAPVIGGSRKMSWAGQTKAKKNWNPNKFANRKTQTSAPLPMAAMGTPGVGLVYGNANWGRP